MDPILIICIIGASLLLLLGVALGFALWSFRMAFYFPNRKKHVSSRLFAFKEHEEFCRAPINELIDELEARSFEEVTLTSHDGLRLFGRIYRAPEGESPDGNVVEIFFHGWRGSPFRDGCGACHTAKDLRHHVLLVDQRAHGDSEGNVITFGIKEKYDCRDWVNFAVSHFGSDVKILLKGLSMGAATVLMASSLELPPNVCGIVADCGYSSPEAIIRKVCRDMGVSDRLGFPFVRLAARLFGRFSIRDGGAVEAVKHTGIPIFIAHGDSDDFVPFEMGREIFDACASPDKVFLEVKGAGHGLAFFFEQERYKQVVFDFQDRVLNRPESGACTREAQN